MCVVGWSAEVRVGLCPPWFKPFCGEFYGVGFAVARAPSPVGERTSGHGNRLLRRAHQCLGGTGALAGRRLLRCFQRLRPRLLLLPEFPLLGPLKTNGRSAYKHIPHMWPSGGCRRKRAGREAGSAASRCRRLWRLAVRPKPPRLGAAGCVSPPEPWVTCRPRDVSERRVEKKEKRRGAR